VRFENKYFLFTLKIRSCLCTTALALYVVVSSEVVGLDPGTDIIFFSIFLPKKWRIDMRFWLETKVNHANIWLDHWVLRKTPIFAEKLPKIAENCDHNIDPWFIKCCRNWTGRLDQSVGRTYLHTCTYKHTYIYIHGRTWKSVKSFSRQSEQIGRMFVQCMIVYIGLFFNFQK
jgi:hypothetical protein